MPCIRSLSGPVRNTFFTMGSVTAGVEGTDMKTGTFDSFIIGIIAALTTLVAGPKTANTWDCSVSFLNATIAFGGDVSSSSISHSSMRPLMPPAAFASSNAMIAPFRLPVPHMAPGPVRLPRIPILILSLVTPGEVCAEAGPAAPASATATAAIAIANLIVISSLYSVKHSMAPTATVNL